MEWEKLAKYCRKTYGVLVDWEERFFECPECGEPIYECDWTDWDLHWCAEDHASSDTKMFCPICEGQLYDREDL